ncbi:phosphonate metabolism protein/1,5-bisphosphokinase (PRPP-forming) PhnN [Pseudoruegeria sp. SK021]|uniref:phosphonate metabolism protein/1,5-bisphosphokinase (PRPP-forming) PhnN n=1 Tax=Pseudoruegeria sp. SK021 TaxID=1933035 RepID=UPI000A249418|nr:phosphonate metabolism protein/1,5-bisphosphokinase (PRPP-forming) PhnN [Pseudoruegeria sp. SK021]OSP55943.1 phosphonate metabolism protein/1,5-bisphosphokinase (PRPP-forming) PhnN [Pseudoruegeria sp. SK021]
MTGRFIAIVGPSGVGKDSVMAGLAARCDRLVLARRTITRPTDAGGEAFDGVTDAAFDAQLAAGGFALHWSAHGLRYGIPVTVDADLAAGRDVVANLSRSVLVQAQARFDACVVIALTASHAALDARLRARGRETAPDIDRRLARSEFSLPASVHAHAIANDGPLDRTIDAVVDLLYPAGR